MSETSLSITTSCILSLEMPYSEQLCIRRTVYRGGDGPRAAIVTGIHGDELEGIYVCQLLADWLQQLARENPAGLVGTVELYPAMNPLGLDTLTRAIPVFDTDLNRNFPGSPGSDLPRRIAHAAMENLSGAALVIDIHASNIYLREIPQVRINTDFADRLVPLAQRLNVDLIWLHGAMTVLEATIAHSLNSIGTPCLVVEMGVGMRITPDYCRQAMSGILTLWKDLGVLAPDVELPPPDHFPLIADDSNVHYLNATTSGLFVPVIEHWTDVRKGQLLGSIVSPLKGGVLDEVRSPVDGILFTLREYPLVYEGSLMARIMARKGGMP
ncbi:MAG: M14 family metallopeptidase [Oryzomonas sp.]|uniref:M14 family metallopeptidase n=1 Tax=Oryzomonas sp. TaxID=2855186 RepID=UPI00284D53EF|nr:M14 family metallopeptidase [Oryzomonas sp.]MDR3578441.1 M14 family metallopeptidase [Oryzomonas sp.]